MNINGNIFLDNAGIDFSLVAKENCECAIKKFVQMVAEARNCHDTFYYSGGEKWDVFYSKSSDFRDPYWQGAGQIAQQLLFNVSDPIFTKSRPESTNDFGAKPDPKTHGGFQYQNHPKSNYVYDFPSIDKWHHDYLSANPRLLEWNGTNGIITRPDLVDYIMKRELQSREIQIKKRSSIANTFYDEIMKKLDKSGVIIAYSQRIGSEICLANYYKREPELESLEHKEGNKKVSMIFSIIKDNKYQFLSIDTQHGMFELCDDKGDHKGEYRFDGSINTKTPEPDHGLQCVAKWKTKFKK